jgi:ERCC4-type nuclease
LATHLETRGLEVARQQLKTGDVVFGGPNGCTYIFELKSVDNLVSDVLKGRCGQSQWSTEQSRLGGEVAAGGGATRCGLVVWGAMPRCDPAVKLGYRAGPDSDTGLSGEAFHTILQRARLAYGLDVVLLPTLADVADWLALLVRNVETGKVTTAGVLDVDARPPDLTRKRKRDAPPMELLASVLAHIPGLTAKVAAALAAKYGSMAALKAAGAAELASFKAGGMKRALGPAIAARLMGIL